jgi:DNA modification methylase
MTISVLGQESGPDWTLWNGDCVEVVRGIPSNSVGLSEYSPPFSSVYTYSGSERDMGNSSNDGEFLKHYSFLAGEILRITKPGRICAVHCKDLVDYKGSSGRAGLRDFPGDLIRIHEAAGWKYHSRVTIWKCPVTEMQRTKAHGLLYKQLRTDSTFSRMGLAEYVLYFRKWAAEGDPVEPVGHTESDVPLDDWQKWASPVWMDIDQTDVLNVEQAREDKDEKHMCPLALPIIERITRLYSNPGDIVFTPFAGIGSELIVATKLGRKAIGVELKPEYFKLAARNLRQSKAQPSLFDRMAVE